MAPSSSVSKVGAAALLFLVIAAFYWKLTLTTQYEWMAGADLAEQVLPWFDLQAREIHHGRMPLWDPYLWSGQPLFGQRSREPPIRSTGSCSPFLRRTATSRLSRWPGTTS